MGLIAVCTVAYRDKSGEMERERQVCATGELAHLGSEQARTCDLRKFLACDVTHARHTSALSAVHSAVRQRTW